MSESMCMHCGVRPRYKNKSYCNLHCWYDSIENDSVVTQLTRLLGEALANKTVKFITVKLDGFRTKRHFTLLGEDGMQIGDFDLLGSGNCSHDMPWGNCCQMQSPNQGDES